ncbi:MAG: cation:proton antiporter [Thermoplasmata archaeon]
MINTDVALLLLAAIAFTGFVLDALFERIRVASVLPLMLVGVVIVRVGLLPSDTRGSLDAIIPFVSALTIAVILFSVGLEIRLSDLFRVVGRASVFTLAVQTASGVALAGLAYLAFHWEPSICFVFGFGISGPSSVAVPVLVRAARISPDLKTTLLFESVLSDVLQLIVPLTLLALLASGNFAPASIGEELALQILGSAAAGVALGLGWLFVLDRLREVTKGYNWTLTITMVLATYAIADLAGLSAAITIFIFGLTVGNALLFDAAKRHLAPSGLGLEPGLLSRSLERVRETLGLTTANLDVEQIQQVHREITFFAGAFFFVYLGVLFEVSALTFVLVAATIGAAVLMLGVRFLFLPILSGYLSTEPTRRRSERALISFNISRGLAAAVIATVPLSMHLVIPGFLDAMFLAILFSTVVSTIGIFALYNRTPAPDTLDVYGPLG